MMSTSSNLLHSLVRLSQLQGVASDKIALIEAIDSHLHIKNPESLLSKITSQLSLTKPSKIKNLDPAQAPAIHYSESNGWVLLRGLNSLGQWVSECWNETKNSWEEEALPELGKNDIFLLDFRRSEEYSKRPVFSLIKDEIFRDKRLIIEALLGSIVINIIALATSFYTMQVYDRVVPTAASQTLLVLSIGVAAAIIYELIAKIVRANLYERLANRVDRQLARSVFLRFLNIRLDQMPKSVGRLSAQLRGYETVKNFLLNLTSKLLVDLPFVFIFILVIAMIAGRLAFIPLVFFIICCLLGMSYKSRVLAFAANATSANNFKTGMLVESIEGAETIKSGQSGWRMLSRWMENSDRARDYETRIRRISDRSLHIVTMFQQFSYILIVAGGALLVSNGNLSMGGLIACSILSGRILTPVASIPAQLIQWAHTKTSLEGLNAIWNLPDDHDGHDHPVVLSSIQRGYKFEDVVVSYGDNPVLDISTLNITAGEKVGILGSVGSGKTTLLRLLSGMYKPQSGRVLLDDIDLAHIAKPVLAENIGFVQQEGRLFAGTLRENLTLGLIDLGDETLMAAARVTGLLDSVIIPHPKGLQQEIYEGGTGLSGGQKQLVNLTRVFLRSPSIWLLDEPTAAVDRNLEISILNALSQQIKQGHTLLLVTHKPEMLKLVDRIIVLSKKQIVLDGPRDKVLQQLESPQAPRNENSS